MSYEVVWVTFLKSLMKCVIQPKDPTFMLSEKNKWISEV